MKIKNFILFFLLFKIIITVKSDSCKKNEPIIIKESITDNVEKGPCVSGTSISMYELNSSIGQTGNVFTTLITNNSDT